MIAAAVWTFAKGLQLLPPHHHHKQEAPRGGGSPEPTAGVRICRDRSEAWRVEGRLESPEPGPVAPPIALWFLLNSCFHLLLVTVLVVRHLLLEAMHLFLVAVWCYG